MSLNSISTRLLPEIETELKRTALRGAKANLANLYEMLSYHLGWSVKSAQTGGSGKRIRPILLLLVAEAAGGDWHKALPAAAAVELIHNFSLIHDDIQDNSELRRGRPTVWKLWGIPQAINTGDAMFTLAFLALTDLSPGLPPEITLEAMKVLQHACLDLTQGQHLDILFEKKTQIKLDDYWPMVRGKTAALLSACTELGALIAAVPDSVQQTYKSFGENLGFAFQAQDDFLGIWGDQALTGKSTQSDLVSGKKSLPILYALQKNEQFAHRWHQGAIAEDEAGDVARLLEGEGARDYTLKIVESYTRQAIDALTNARPASSAAEALNELAHLLLQRAL